MHKSRVKKYPTIPSDLKVYVEANSRVKFDGGQVCRNNHGYEKVQNLLYICN